MTGQIVRAIIMMIMAAISYMQGTYIFGGMAPNPFAYEFCPPHACTPTPVSTPRPPKQPTPTSTSEAPSEPTPTPIPTEDPWMCPAIGDFSKKEYKDLCMESCKDAGLNGCGRICGDCWESE